MSYMQNMSRDFPAGVGGQEYFRLLGDLGYTAAGVVPSGAERKRVREAFGKSYAALEHAGQTVPGDSPAGSDLNFNKDPGASE